MYLKKIKSRKRDKLKRTKSKFKYIKRLYSIKKGGGNISENDIINDDVIHLYLGNIKMNEKPGNILDTATPPVSGTSEKTNLLPSTFNIDEFMKLLNRLYINADKSLKKAIYYAYTYSVTSSFPIKMTEHLKKFTEDSRQLLTGIDKSMKEINKISITNEQFNDLGPKVFTNQASDSWIFLLKDILIDLFVSISESIYGFTLKQEEYEEIESSKSRLKPIKSPKIEEIGVVHTTLIKEPLNNKNKPSYKYILPVLFEVNDKPLSVGRENTLLQNTLDICIIELLYDLINECSKPDKQIDIIKNDLSNLQYVMFQMNEMVKKELGQPQNNDALPVVDTPTSELPELGNPQTNDADNIYKNFNPSIVKNNTNTSKRITKLSCKIKNGEVCCNQKLSFLKKV